MLVIRLFRVGKKNQPSFKIVVTDKKKASRKGRFVQELGFYNPLTKEKVLKAERIKYWLSVGAKPSATVHNLLVSEKIIEGKKSPKHKKTKKLEEDKSSSRPSPSKEGLEKKEKPVEEKPAEEEPTKAPAKTEEKKEEPPKTE
jgi:small subunit ribosomal protein S16